MTLFYYKMVKASFNHSKTEPIGPVFERSKAKRQPFCFNHSKPGQIGQVFEWLKLAYTIL
jgi:hypothetical protein